MFKRKDAKRCKDISGVNQIMIDLKPKRSLGELYINQKMDLTKFVEYFKKQKIDHPNLTYFHAFMTLFAKTIANRPFLNRFIMNRHIYEHNDISLSYIMKVSFNDYSEALMVVMPILNNDNLFTISDKVGKKVSNIRNSEDKGSGANKAIHIVGKLPNIMRIPIMGIFKLADKFGVLPASLIKDNIYYSSMIVSNLGTFDFGGIYHNVTDFGTCSGIITIGKIEEVKENKQTKYYCEFGITMDERIADGFYFIKSIQLMQYILDNPELLEDNIDAKIEMKD